MKKKIPTTETIIHYHKVKGCPTFKFLQKKHQTKGKVVALSQDVLLSGWHAWIKPHAKTK